jgi:putative membrane protein insertion efficiency factor
VLIVASLRALIRLYQLAVSALLGPACRFEPSCSEFAREALHVHGVVRGSALAVRRVSRCHPFHPGGFDPVPSAPIAADVVAASFRRRRYPAAARKEIA